MGPYAGVDYNSPYLIVNSAVSYPPPLQGKGVEWGNLSYWLSTFVSVCLIPKPFFMKTQVPGEGKGG
jgi:hypothetical protein